MAQLKRSERASMLRALGLVAPLAIFLILLFIVPIAMLLGRSVDDPAVRAALPATVAALADWTDEGLPSDAAYAALVEDLRKATSPQDLASAATRLNYGLAGMRSLLMSTRAKLERAEPGNARATLIDISPKWGATGPWAAIRQARGPLTDFYILTSLDLKRDAAGSLERVPEEERAFVPTIARTFEIALGVTVLALLVGFPFAYLITTVPDRWARFLMFMVLLPFWTAVLVRTLSWTVLLQREGIINGALAGLGILDHPLDLIYNRFSVYVGLVHIFLPYMILPLYSVMRTVPESHLRAAASLGATPFTVFRRVYLPQLAPGIAAGSLLVFIQCLGVFVIPAILGGAGDQGIAYMIAFYVNKTLNWGLAAALSIVLLVSVLIFYWLFSRLSGNTRIRIG